MPNDDLCGGCQALFEGNSHHDVERKSFTHHADAASFERALTSKCPLCVRIWHDSSKPAILEGTRCEIRSYANAAANLGTASYLLTFTDDANILVQFFLLPSDHEMTSHISHVQLTDHTGSDCALGFVTAKYKECREHHVQCRRASPDQHFVPKRVIDVSQPQQDCVRVCERENIQGDVSYATLSHCWGSVQPLKLTTETARQFQQGISTRQLSRTFQHAIEVTRRLNLKFLWIDSLCIVQDNISDWAAEARCMRQIYGNAACGIAATAAVDGTGGLFFDRDPITFMPLAVDVTSARHADPMCPEFFSKGSYYFSTTRGTVQTIGLAPLNQRTWVAQERYLSPRIAHFTAETLYWECHETFSNELYPTALPPWVVRMETMRDLRPFKQVIQIHPPVVGPEESGITETESPAVTARVNQLLWKREVYAAWCTFRRFYTGCKLTKEDDKLIALSGIAEAVAPAMYGASSHEAQYSAQSPNDQLVFGLWTSHLLQELCWGTYIGTEAQHASRPKKWRAPTWSWASTNQAVVRSATAAMWLVKEHSLFHLYPCLEPVSLPRGDQSPAPLTLSCRLISIKLRSDASSWHAYVFLDDEPEVSAEEMLKWSRTSATMDDPIVDAAAWTTLMPYLIIVQHCRSQDDDCVTFFEGIIIVPSTQRHGAFERIGSFHTLNLATSAPSSGMQSIWASEEVLAIADEVGVPPIPTDEVVVTELICTLLDDVAAPTDDGFTPKDGKGKDDTITILDTSPSTTSAESMSKACLTKPASLASFFK
ncbi:heterokaryon incompatibility protein-domain-containing protein [Paraphoma chrysanthemicola]|uniref:Heterokaryon incompatibility protein-domain-containing protein n=1 Tax=Paraphoma chrysanthemicola TaxID=798071 RepID=A0A8K0R7H5_9PLEO|nr:heterokaryon incompatibility protein-domain-containing protein [Paraphoma chrysanthemicola]